MRISDFDIEGRKSIIVTSSQKNDGSGQSNLERIKTKLEAVPEFYKLGGKNPGFVFEVLLQDAWE